MWNAAPNPVRTQDIANEHWRVLARAIEAAEDDDPRSREVAAALDYFRARVIREGGLNLIEAGLRDGNLEHLRNGLRALRLHLGGVVTVCGIQPS